MFHKEQFMKRRSKNEWQPDRRPSWAEPISETPKPLRADNGPAYRPGQRVAVLTFDDPPRELHGELRAIDGPLAVVCINGRSERVDTDRIKRLDSQP